MVKPSDEFYGRLQYAYDFFNHQLFGGELPHCLITVQREKNTMGFFSPARWRTGGGECFHEIALNPAYFAERRVIEVFQTLVHEQCHLWQHEFGQPSRAGYHNYQWSQKMESIGLMPSDTGEPGGKQIGQKMADYPIEGGLFRKACVLLVSSGYQFDWVDRRIAKQYQAKGRKGSLGASWATNLASAQADEVLESAMAKMVPNFEVQLTASPSAKGKYKVKYYCRGCGTNVWGKLGLTIRCEACDRLFNAA